MEPKRVSSKGAGTVTTFPLFFTCVSNFSPPFLPAIFQCSAIDELLSACHFVFKAIVEIASELGKKIAIAISYSVERRRLRG